MSDTNKHALALDVLNQARKQLPNAATYPGDYYVVEFAKAVPPSIHPTRSFKPTEVFNLKTVRLEFKRYGLDWELHSVQ